MSRQKTSAKTLSGRFIIGYLFLVSVCLISLDAFGQEKPDLTKPFKKCRSYGANNGVSRVVASDNVSEIVLTNDEFKLISIDSRTRRENWITETGGRLETEAVSDGINLFYLTTFVNENKSKIFTLNSISLQTGITIWQKRIIEYSNVRLYPLQDKKRIFLIADSKILSMVDKAGGDILWKTAFPGSIVSVGSVSGSYLSVLTEDRLYRLLLESGGIVEGWKISDKLFNKAILRDNNMFVGYSTGEVARIAAGGDRIRVFWKIKTGGSISGLYELDDGILAASLDNFLYLFSMENGSVRWKRRVSGRINITPLIYGNYAVVLSSADNLATIIDLSDGKVVNQLKIEDDNYFSGQPFVFGNQIVLQTYRGVYLFVNSNLDCP